MRRGLVGLSFFLSSSFLHISHIISLKSNKTTYPIPSHLILFDSLTLTRITQSISGRMRLVPAQNRQRRTDLDRDEWTLASEGTSWCSSGYVLNTRPRGGGGFVFFFFFFKKKKTKGGVVVGGCFCLLRFLNGYCLFPCSSGSYLKSCLQYANRWMDGKCFGWPFFFSFLRISLKKFLFNVNGVVQIAG